MSKKITTALLAIFTAISFSSCVKTFICECTYTEGQSLSYSTEETFVGTKKNAQSQCDDFKDDIQNGYNLSGTGSTSCTLESGF